MLMTRFLLRWLTLRFVWLIVAPFAYLLAALGICWLIDLLDRIRVLSAAAYTPRRRWWRWWDR